MAPSIPLTPIAYDALAGWGGDDHLAAFHAFRRSAVHALSKPYRASVLPWQPEDFAAAFAEAAEMPAPDRAGARTFFESHFAPVALGEEGFVTGFYEPQAEARTEPGATFRFPLYARPDDLVAVDESRSYPELAPGTRFARREGNGFVPYHDRAAIEAGALAGRGLELAWLEDRVDLFFIHVQGAARLRFADGTLRRVTYAAKSGHPFTGPGRVLVERGELSAGSVTMQSIRRWLADHPGRIDEILHCNRSFIFFREAPVADAALGPIAAAKVPLTPLRSIAVDRLIHMFGTPFFIRADEIGDGKPFARLVIAQDTGSAIVGAARADLFFGSGGEAGETAGVVRHPAEFFCLVPKDAARRLSP